MLLAACGKCMGGSDERIFDVSVLSDMIQIKNGIKTCDIFNYNDVSDVITEITVL